MKTTAMEIMKKIYLNVKTDYVMIDDDIQIQVTQFYIKHMMDNCLTLLSGNGLTDLTFDYIRKIIDSLVTCAVTEHLTKCSRITKVAFEIIMEDIEKFVNLNLNRNKYDTSGKRIIG